MSEQPGRGVSSAFRYVMAREKRKKEKSGEGWGEYIHGRRVETGGKEREGGQAFGEQERRSKRIDSPQI